MPHRQDKQLLIAARSGDQDAAALLWNRHAPRLLTFARCILKQTALAEDAVQGVFCAILELNRRTIAAVEDPASWLAALTRRHALNALRAARRTRTRESTRPLAREPDSLSALSATTAPDVAAAVDALPRRLREVVVLKHAGGLTLDQIALALAANRNTVAARYRAACDTLRRRLHSLSPALSEASHG